MIKKLSGEVWKPIALKGASALTRKYAVSNQGRVASYVKDVEKDGKIIKGSTTAGYKTLNLHIDTGNVTIYIHREVARLFCAKKSPKHKYVVHTNHKRQDNSPKNLKWCTLEEMSEHQQKSPAKKAYKLQQANRTVGLKLDAKKVAGIKTLLNNPKRKLTIKQIAEKYGVSEMTMYRIKTGENWKNVK